MEADKEYRFIIHDHPMGVTEVTLVDVKNYGMSWQLLYTEEAKKKFPEGPAFMQFTANDIAFRFGIGYWVCSIPPGVNWKDPHQVFNVEWKDGKPNVTYKFGARKVVPK